MELANKLIYFAFGMITFCVGTFLLVYSAKQYQETLVTVHDHYIEDTAVYQQYYPQNDDLVSHSELISILFYPLEYDIEIDGVLINKATHTRELINSYGIKDGSYKKSYQYDQNGKIIKIIYMSVINNKKRGITWIH